MSAPIINVISVESRAEHRQFCDLPYRLYDGDPHWVPPLRSDEHARWDARRNPSLRYRHVRRFLARQDGHIVGRAAAIVDPAFEERWGKDGGFFGCFESTNEPFVAQSLLAAVEDALLAQGKTSVLGPVNLTLHDETATLVQGFSRPTLLSPYNPPYHVELLKSAGYYPRHAYRAYLWRPDAPMDPAIGRLLRRLRANRSLNIRPVEPRRWDAEVALLRRLYNECFADVWGFTPMHDDEFAYRARRFRPFLRPELMLVAEDSERPVGFCVVLPDINVALQPLNGRLFPWGWLRLLRQMPRIDTARFVLLGVHPSHAGAGIAALIVDKAIAAARRTGLREVELSLIHESNDRVQHVIEAFGGRAYKTFQLFEKKITTLGPVRRNRVP